MRPSRLGNFLLSSSQRLLSATCAESSVLTSAQCFQHQVGRSYATLEAVDAPKASPEKADLFHNSRFGKYYNSVLYRELLLKSNPKRWHTAPQLHSVVLTINTSDTRLERDVVDKWEMLLYSLALEHISGQPATFLLPPNKHSVDRATGVTTTLTGEKMYSFLEKLVYIILPNQIGFEGVSQPDAHLLIPQRPQKGKVAVTKPSKYKAVDFKVTNLLLYPDFEQNFDLFEPLRSMQVRLNIDAESHEACNILLSGLSLPQLPPGVPVKP